MLTVYAQATSRIRVGTGVVPIYTRTPATMAQTAATIDELSGRPPDARASASRTARSSRAGTGRRSTGRSRRCASTPRSCARSCAARPAAAGREVADRLPAARRRPAPRAADLHRRPLARDAAPRRRDRRRRGAVAVQPRATSREVVIPEVTAGRETRRAGRSRASTSSRRCPARPPRTATPPTRRCAKT